MTNRGFNAILLVVLALLFGASAAALLLFRQPHGVVVASDAASATSQACCSTDARDAYMASAHERAVDLLHHLGAKPDGEVVCEPISELDDPPVDTGAICMAMVSGSLVSFACGEKRCLP